MNTFRQNLRNLNKKRILLTVFRGRVLIKHKESHDKFCISKAREIILDVRLNDGFFWER